MGELAGAMAHGRAVGVDTALLDASKHLYERQAHVALEHKDLRHAETFVQHAHSAEAKIPDELRFWVKFLKRLNDARKVPEDRKDMLPSMLGMLKEAEHIGLPNCSDLEAVTKRVQAWSTTNLGATSTSRSSNPTASEYEHLLEKVEEAEAANINSSDVTKARDTVLSYAKAELSQATTA